MASWKELTPDRHTATAGELINLTVAKKPFRAFNAIQEEFAPKPRWLVTLQFGPGLTRELPTPFKKIKQAKRAAEAEANKLIATALMDINLIELAKEYPGYGRVRKNP